MWEYLYINFTVKKKTDLNTKMINWYLNKSTFSRVLFNVIFASLITPSPFLTAETRVKFRIASFFSELYYQNIDPAQ
jgi:hypothetical protein